MVKGTIVTERNIESVFNDIKNAFNGQQLIMTRNAYVDDTKAAIFLMKKYINCDTFVKEGNKVLLSGRHIKNFGEGSFSIENISHGEQKKMIALRDIHGTGSLIDTTDTVLIVSHRIYIFKNESAVKNLVRPHYEVWEY